MLVERYLIATHEKVMGKLSVEAKKTVISHVKKLVSWAENHPVKDALWDMAPVIRVVECEGDVREVMIDVFRWKLLESNFSMVGMVDDIIVRSLKILKNVGIDEPLVVLCREYFLHIFSDGIECSQPVWRSIYFLFQRMSSSARIAVRLKRMDDFGARGLWRENGVLSGFEYDGRGWRRQLAERQLIQRRK